MSDKKRRKWDSISMKKAIDAVKNKEMGYLKASRIFKVPKSTLENYLKNNKVKEDINLGRRTTLPKDIENDLVEHCLLMEKNFFGLTLSDVKRLAYQLATRNNIPHPFSTDKGSAGKKWLKGFLNRHTNLSIRTPRGVSSARVKGFTEDNVKCFFEILEPVLKTVNFDPHKIYNVDETGVTNVQHKTSKVISLKGKRQIGSLTAAERGSLVTLVTCMNAAGRFIPPLFVFPRKNMKQELMDGAPAGSFARCHPSGWIQENFFTDWLKHFIKFVKPSKDDPVVLILDGHYSHTRNIDVINIARDNHIAIVCLFDP